MNENGVEVGEKLTSLTLYNIPEEDAREFEKIMRKYRGNTGRAAFKEMLARYKFGEILGGIFEQINELQQRIESLEGKDEKVEKTFGGNIIRRSV